VTHPELPGDPDARLAQAPEILRTLHDDSVYRRTPPDRQPWAPAIAPVPYVRLAPFAAIVLGPARLRHVLHAMTPLGHHAPRVDVLRPSPPLG
jgi:hypothetical protein